MANAVIQDVNTLQYLATSKEASFLFQQPEAESNLDDLAHSNCARADFASFNGTKAS